jgi:hypothetical protein
MDTGKLPQDLTEILAPCLPYLIDTGKDLAKDAVAKIGGEAIQLARSLWDKLRHKLTDRPAAQEAVKDVAAAPDDEDARGALRIQLRKLLESDATLAQELAQLIAKSPRNVTAAGDRSVAIGGDAKDSVIVTGDHSRIGPSGRK